MEAQAEACRLIQTQLTQEHFYTVLYAVTQRQAAQNHIEETEGSPQRHQGVDCAEYVFVPK